ncbi:hypothetical protein G7046_g2949 [Stylonectria norvegica]|nr:hypothetical protein G7046_g2949 [Stylonectria norvegica]
MSRADQITASPPKANLGDLWWLAPAKKFCALGATKVILGVRSLERGQIAKNRIEESLGKGSYSGVIVVFELDMLSFASIEEFVRAVSAKYGEIHIAVLNAGIATINHETSAEGWELSLHVNVISTAYLALLLVPKLRQTSRESGTSSVLDGSILQKVNDKANFSMLLQYHITKLLVMYVMHQISESTPTNEVVVLSVCPGLCKSDIARDGSFFLRKLDGVWKSLFARTAEEGSRTYVSGAALGPEASGQFWTHDRLAKQGLLVTSEEGKELRRRIWGELIEVLEKRNPQIVSTALFFARLPTPNPARASEDELHTLRALIRGPRSRHQYHHHHSQPNRPTLTSLRDQPDTMTKITRAISVTNFMVATSALGFQVFVLYPWHKELDDGFEDLKTEHKKLLETLGNKVSEQRRQELSTKLNDLDTRNSKRWWWL